MEQTRSRRIIKRVAIAFLLALAGGVGTLVGRSVLENVYPLFRPSPYHFLEGVYAGYWDWTDQNNRKQKTNDTVYFESTADGKLIGRGIDPQLGTYTFKGNLNGKHVSAAYLNDIGTAQPAQSGSFELDVVQKKPLILKGVWTGYYNGTRIAGTAILTKKAE